MKYLKSNFEVADLAQIGRPEDFLVHIILRIQESSEIKTLPLDDLTLTQLIGRISSYYANWTQLTLILLYLDQVFK